MFFKSDLTALEMGKSENLRFALAVSTTQNHPQMPRKTCAGMG
jgi:hypothetical protein